MAAKPVKIVAERCKNGIKQLKFAKPAKDAPIFKYQRHLSLIQALFHLQFSFILIDGLFCGPIFVHNKLSKSSIKKSKLIKLNYSLQVKRAWTKEIWLKAQFFATRWPASNRRSIWTKNYLYWQRCLSRWSFCQKGYSYGRADFLLLWNNVQSKGTSNFL